MKKIENLQEMMTFLRYFLRKIDSKLIREYANNNIPNLYLTSFNFDWSDSF